VWYRVYGEKEPDDSTETLSEDETDVMLHSLLMESQRDFLFEHRNLDFSYTMQWQAQDFRFRADLYFDLDHLALNMRLIATDIRPFKGLGLHPNVVRAIMLAYDKQGLTLVTGITGSGKSSTLDSIIDANNQTVAAHIVIIGSPIETIHPPKRSIVRHREVGRDVLSFKAGAVQALRQDPDIIVIGEMRDPETIITALEITDSGHKVFSTLHTASAVESIDRIIGECPAVEQNRVRERLADVLKCCLSQKLVPSLDGKRALVKEVLLVNGSVRAAIKNENTNEIYQMMYEGKDRGMNTLEQDLKRLVEEKKVSAEEAMNHSNNKRRMEELL
jgi:twitching motility protein PilT